MLKLKDRRTVSFQIKANLEHLHSNNILSSFFAQRIHKLLEN